MPRWLLMGLMAWHHEAGRLIGVEGGGASGGIVVANSERTLEGPFDCRVDGLRSLIWKAFWHLQRFLASVLVHLSLERVEALGRARAVV